MTVALRFACDLLDAVDRRQRLCTIEVETGDPISVVVFVEMRQIATENNGSGLRQLDK